MMTMSKFVQVSATGTKDGTEFQFIAVDKVISVKIEFSHYQAFSPAKELPWEVTYSYLGGLTALTRHDSLKVAFDEVKVVVGGSMIQYDSIREAHFELPNGQRVVIPYPRVIGRVNVQTTGQQPTNSLPGWVLPQEIPLQERRYSDGEVSM